MFNLFFAKPPPKDDIISEYSPYNAEQEIVEVTNILL